MANIPKHILNALRNNMTSLGEHPSFPPEEEEKFLIDIIANVYDEVIDVDIDNTEEYAESLRNELGRIIGECKRLERNNKQSLEDLCAKIITDMFKIPEDTIDIEANIVDKVDTSNERLIPEKTSKDFSFDDIDDMYRLSDEIYKRRMLNALVTGAAMYHMNIIGDYIKEIFDIDCDLPSLYKKLIKNNLALLYIEKDSLDATKTTDGGKVDVTISSGDNFPSVKSQALLFPILVEETIKGILELAVSHGLPENFEKAKYVISKSDFKLAEIWDMRLGYALWTLIEREIEKCGFDINEIGVNFFLMELSKLDCDTFNSTLKEIFARTKKGKEIISEISEGILYNKEKDDFDDFIQNKNDSTFHLNDDDFFEPNELITDNYIY